jgi:hypothetical protein
MGAGMVIDRQLLALGKSEATDAHNWLRIDLPEEVLEKSREKRSQAHIFRDAFPRRIATI